MLLVCLVSSVSGPSRLTTIVGTAEVTRDTRPTWPPLPEHAVGRAGPCFCAHSSWKDDIRCSYAYEGYRRPYRRKSKTRWHVFLREYNSNVMLMGNIEEVEVSWRVSVDSYGNAQFTPGPIASTLIEQLSGTRKILLKTYPQGHPCQRDLRT